MAIPFLAVALWALPITAQDHPDDSHAQHHQDQRHDQGHGHAQGHDQGRGHDQSRGDAHNQGNGYGRGDHNWKRGERMRQDDWNRGRRVDDWRERHFRRPPRGYEWRDLDGRYVLASPGGIILSIHLR